MTRPTLALLQAIPQSLVTPVMLALMFGVFYFFIIRPQARRQKQQEMFQQEVQRGDQVVMSSGIVGRVSKVDKDGGTVTVETGKGVYLDFTLGSISRDLTVAKFGERNA